MSKHEKRLLLVKNNAYSTVLLLDGGTVVGAWPTDEYPGAMADYLADRGNPDALEKWSENWPDSQSVGDWGEPVNVTRVGVGRPVRYAIED